MKAIIPCAGFGTRVNMKPNQAKELLLDNSGAPIIEYSLNLCKKYDLEPLVVTRPEKFSLNDYLLEAGVDFIMHDGSGEWPTSILMSKDYWEDEGNILLLPDTRFEPTTIIQDIKINLNLGRNASIAIHKVEDVSKWGQVINNTIIEKPTTQENGWAWGIIGFQRHYGEELFTAMKTRNSPLELKNTGIEVLEKFEDITRGKS